MNIRLHLITEPMMKIPSKVIYIDNIHCILEGPDIVFLIEDRSFTNHWHNTVTIIGYQLFLDDIIMINENLDNNDKIELKSSHTFKLYNIKFKIQLSSKVNK